MTVLTLLLIRNAHTFWCVAHRPHHRVKSLLRFQRAKQHNMAGTYIPFLHARVTGVPIITGPGGWPTMQLQEFEPAFYTSQPIVAALPYSPPALTVVTPAGGVTAAAGVTTLTAPGCGCSALYSPLPPSGLRAWERLVFQANAPLAQFSSQF